MNRALTIVIYLVVFVVSFVFFLVAKLPVDAIIGHYLAAIEEDNKGEFRVMMGKREINLLFDSKVEDLHIQKKTSTGYSNLFHATKLQFGISFIRVLMGDYSVSFVAKMPQGKISGEAFWSDDRKILKLTEIKNVSLERELGVLRDLLPMQLSGTVSGEMAFSFSGEPSFARSGARIDIKITDFRMAETPLKDLGIEIPVPFNTWIKDPVSGLTLSGGKPAWIDVVIDQGKIQINHLDLNGEDIDLKAKGKLTINLKKTKGAYTGVVDAMLKVSKQFETDNETLFGSFENDRDQDGAYRLVIKGDLFSAAAYTVGKTNIGEMLKSLGQ